MTDEQLKVFVDVMSKAGPDWAGILQAIVSVITLVAVWAGLNQLRQMKREFAADHARSRRQLAVELCSRWAEGQESETFEMCKFIDHLEKNQIDSILSSSSFTVPTSATIQLRKIFEGYEHAEECLSVNGEITQVTELGSQQIRYLAIRYLNQLETVFIAWNSGICDKRIIELQFGPLLDGRSGRNALSSFRDQVGKDHFPNFELFVEEQQRNNSHAVSVQADIV